MTRPRGVNILFVTHHVPSPSFRRRAYNHIKHLAQRHRIYLVALVSREDQETPTDIGACCQEIVTFAKPLWRSLLDCLWGLPTRRPLRVSYCLSPQIEKTVREMVQRYAIDLVYVKRLRMSYAAQRLPLPKVLDLTDCMALLFRRSLRTVPWPRRLLVAEEYWKHRLYEPLMAAHFDRTLVCSPDDARFLTEVQRAPRVVMVPNTVDTAFFCPVESPAEDDDLILYYGMFAFSAANVDGALFLAQRIFPIVRALHPRARLVIAGGGPTAAMRRLQEAPHIRVTGYVPDLRPYMAQAAVVVAPLRMAAGMRNKVLEAMAMGKAVVSTTLGAEGIEGITGDEVLLADDPQDFARAVVRCLQDPQQRRAMGRRARQFILDHYSMERVGAQLEAVLEEVVARHNVPHALYGS